MEDQLREAVTMGLVAEVDRLLQKGVNPHTLDDNGSSLLHLACSVGDLKMLQLLLKYPLDIESTDESGSTPLHVACERGSTSCAELLVESGARQDAKNDKKKTPLQYVKNKDVLAKLKRIVPKPRTLLTATSSDSTGSPASPGSPSILISGPLGGSQELAAQQQALNEKTQTLLQREDDLIQRESMVRSKEMEIKRRQQQLESKNEELQDQRNKYDKSEKQLKKMVDAHNRNEFVASMCVISWPAITVKTKVGYGSFAAVYKGVWRGTQVAVKKPFLSNDNPSHGLPDADCIDLFCREVKLLSKLRHPNIVLLMAVCLDKENMCVVLEMCKADLYKVIHDPSIALTPKKRIGFAIDVTQGLLYMHTHSPALLHRDIKSSNMLVSPSGEVKLIDFGYASYVGESDFVFTRHQLNEKANKGTPAYMAPECLLNQEVTTKSDIYSLGTVLWELMTRKVPYAGKSPESIYAEVTTGNRLPIPTDPTFPPALGELIHACWLESPSDRPSAKTVLKALRGIRKSM